MGDDTTSGTASPKKLYTTVTLSDYLGVSIRTLYNWQSDGKGPKYVKLGGGGRGNRVRYMPEDVEKWLDSQKTDL